MDEFALKSSGDDCAVVFHGREPADRARPLDYFELRVTRTDLSAAARVWAGQPLAHPAPWLHDLARHWQGWQGEKIWNSVERELALVATCDRTGHVTIRMELRSGLMERDWSLRAFVVVDAGQLDELARQATRFFGEENLLDAATLGGDSP